MERVTIQIRRLRKGRVVSLPTYMTSGASGMDLFACLDEALTLVPGERKLIPTGISVAIPEGFEGQVRPRSGLAIRNGIGVVNGPGTIDADYRGEVGVVLINFGKEPFTVRDGDRVAQMVISRIFRAVWEEVDDLPSTERQDGGFGHTGL